MLETIQQVFRSVNLNITKK